MAITTTHTIKAAQHITDTSDDTDNLGWAVGKFDAYNEAVQSLEQVAAGHISLERAIRHLSDLRSRSARHVVEFKTLQDERSVRTMRDSDALPTVQTGERS